VVRDDKATMKLVRCPWDDYARRLKQFVAVVLGIPVMIVIVFTVLSWFQQARFTVFWLLGFVWGVGYLVALTRLVRFPCPRCSRPFFAKPLWMNPFAVRCVNCGFRKWAKV